MNFDEELFERFLNSEVENHTGEDASNVIDGLISDAISNDVNMGIRFEEADAGNFFLFSICFFYFFNHLILLYLRVG